jgi:Tfp pilus assembly protein PilF/SAM-dependent methyltransferase
MALNTERVLQQAVSLHRAGQLREAGGLYRNILEVNPNHIDSLHLLGVVSHQAGRSDLAIELIGKAIALDRRNPDFHNNMGEAYRALGRMEEAVSHYTRAIKLKRDHCAAHNNLGIALMDQDKLADAVVHFRRALILKPDYAEAHMNLGLALMQQGKLDEAETRFEQALTLDPSYPEAHNGFGALLMRQRKVSEAITRFERAIEAKPNYAMAYRNLAQALFTQNNLEYALASVRCALGLTKTRDAQALFVQCIKDMRPTHDVDALRDLIIEATSEGWDRPVELARVSASLIKLNPTVREGIHRAIAAWPRRLPEQDLLRPHGLAELSQDQLLRCMLESAPACDIELEQLLGAIRFVLLEAATAAGVSDAVSQSTLDFYSALAQQCFINEYVFISNDAEQRRALELRSSLIAAAQSGAPIPVLWLLAVAAYFPLHSLPNAETLLGRTWPDAVARVLMQQVSEPREEQQIRATIRRLTEIDDHVSLLVKQQYEENPYPRWVKLPAAAAPVTVDDHLKAGFDRAAYVSPSKNRTVEILVAGCGTGQHPINTACRFKDAHVLAVDLSLTSLSYAQRKTRSLGLANLEYAQADLLQLASIGRSFDIIETSGVLHHLADPLQGWQVLLSLLRPRGLMSVGLYSELARADVVEIRNLIAERGYGQSADDIRRCRQELMTLDDGRMLKDLSRSPDLYSTSGCRDLLFHVQEHRLTLPEIKKFLLDNDLSFIGFELDLRLVALFKARFPGDASAVANLDLWHMFETENPRTFAGMYQFIVQKS